MDINTTARTHPNSIRTHSGKLLNLLDPQPDDIIITDIAHGLNNMPRFAGQCAVFYSVLSHSYSCSIFVEQGHELDALMHDASEAYLMDIPSPIKKLLPQYKQIEDRLMRVIAEKFGFTYPLPDAVKLVDRHMLRIEWDSLFSHLTPPPPLLVATPDQFIKRFNMLK